MLTSFTKMGEDREARCYWEWVLRHLLDVKIERSSMQLVSEFDLKE